MLRRDSQVTTDKVKHSNAGDKKRKPREKKGEREMARAAEACTRHTTSFFCRAPSRTHNDEPNRTAARCCLFSKLHSLKRGMCAG